MRQMVSGFFTAIPSAILGLLAAVTLAHAANLPLSVFIASAVIGSIVGGLGQRSESHLVFAAPTSLLVLTTHVFSEGGLSAVAAFSILVGVIQIGLAISPLARWLPLIPERIHQGILLGLGVLILVKAVKLGIPPLNGNATWDTKIWTTSLAISAVALSTILLWKKITPDIVYQKVPAVIAAGIVCVLLQLVFRGLSEECVGESCVDHMKFGAIEWSRFWNALGNQTIWLAAVSGALISASKMNAIPHQDSDFNTFRHNTYALAATNLACGLCLAPPVAVIAERSALSASMSTSRWSIILQGPLVLAMLSAHSIVLRLVPSEFMTAVLLWTGWRFLGVASIKTLWKQQRSEAITILSVGAAVLSTDISLGILVGIVIGFVRLAWTFAQDYEINVMSHPDNPGFAIVKLRGAFTFACLPALDEVLWTLKEPTQIFIDQTGVYYCDSSLEHYFNRKAKEYSATGRELVIQKNSGFSNPSRQAIRHSILTKADIQTLDRRSKPREGIVGRRRIDQILHQNDEKQKTSKKNDRGVA